MTVAMKQNHVSVCICTFRRPEMLARLLEELAKQNTDGFSFSVVVCDNDASRSAEPTVLDFARRSPVTATYCHEPRQNIALARNRSIEAAEGDHIAFMDDDEFPAPEWLAKLWQTLHQFDAAGVLGPVRPHFDQPPPAWIVRGRFCERPEHPTGFLMDWNECRTGNLLFRRAIIPADELPFREQFGTGGEDKDFFMRMTERGSVFRWCNEAVAYETVPPSRQTRGYMLHRALLRGRNSLKFSRGRAVLIVKSLLAVPLYALVLPVTLLLGQHRFMCYSIKFCDHFGRLLALLGLNPIRERQM